MNFAEAYKQKHDRLCETLKVPYDWSMFTSDAMEQRHFHELLHKYSPHRMKVLYTSWDARFKTVRWTAIVDPIIRASLV